MGKINIFKMASSGLSKIGGNMIKKDEIFFQIINKKR